MRIPVRVAFAVPEVALNANFKGLVLNSRWTPHSLDLWIDSTTPHGCFCADLSLHGWAVAYRDSDGEQHLHINAAHVLYLELL